MSFTVWGAFDSFRTNQVDLDPDVTKKARKSRDNLYEQLGNLAKNDAEFPKLTGSNLGFGSFARRTKIRPLDDIDFLLLLKGGGTTAYQSTGGNIYNYWLKINDTSAPLNLFRDELGYVSSIKVMNKIKSALANLNSYRRSDIHRNMQAITLNLTSYDWSFDIVPAVAISDNSGNTLYYLIPNGSGDWMRTDPRIDDANVTRLNTQHDGEFLPTLRLLKYWNRRTHKPVLESYYFETLVLKVFDYAKKIKGFPQAAKYFFDYGSTYLWSSCPDPKNLGPALDAKIDTETKQKIAEAFAEAAKHAGYALMYEGQSDNKNAIYWWGRVFGSDFPNYG